MVTPSFRTRARVISQLGEQLIKNESIALLELIKNSYDADSSKCTVLMSHPDNIDKGYIEINDDGEGMSFDVLSTVWLEIGTSYKDDLRKNKKDKRSPKYGRHRLGEKGIGRLGVHRLGKEIEVVTRKDDEMECVLRIDWRNIQNSKYIEDMPIEVFERKAEVFTSGTGTRITIKHLRKKWTRKLARDTSRTIMALNSPFDSDDSFNVLFKIKDSNWLKGLLTFSDIETYKLFTFDVTMKGNEVVDFHYEFMPWDTMQKLEKRIVTFSDNEVSNLKRMQYKSTRQHVDIDLDKFPIGEVRFKGVIFDLDTRVLSLGVQDKLGLKKYLKQNGGVRVYRDNMRVLDYGDPGNDWLDLAGRRVNVPAKRISNNIILGAVYLNRDQSDGLEEKANREGFVEEEAYWELWHSIRFAIDRIESLRKTDKDLLRKHYGPKSTSEPVITSITELKDVVEKNVSDEPVRIKINKYLDRIENEYDSITNSLMKSAGAGLNLIVVIHQIEKIIKELKVMLKGNVGKNILENRVKVLSDMVEGYSILVKKSDRKVRDIKKIVENSIFNMKFRLDAHKINLITNFHNETNKLVGLCSEDHVLNALMNIFDNSIWWLGYSKIKEPEIYLDITSELKDHTTIIVADNGPGFTQPTEEIVKPFVSDKPGGMGIGLHLTQQIMESLDGKLFFPEMDYFDIPDKYEKGAKIALAFKNKGA